MGKKHFSDEDIKKYCEDVAENLDYLYNVKNVKHIRYYCFSNEMSCVMWGALLKDLPLFKKYHEGLFSAFQKRNLPIGLLATDASGYDYWETIDYAIKNMPSISEDFCLHIYEREHDIYNLEFIKNTTLLLAEMIFRRMISVWIRHTIGTLLHTNRSSDKAPLVIYLLRD
jgi:hypothetical protein